PAQQAHPAYERRVPVLNSSQVISTQTIEEQRGAAQNEIDLLAYWQLLVKRRWLILGILAAATSIALVETLLTTPVYRATTVIQIEKENIQVIDVRGMSQASADYSPGENQTQFGLLNSRSLAERVAEDLGLADSDIGK